MPQVPKRIHPASPVESHRVAPLSQRHLTDQEGIPRVRAVTLFDGLADNNLGNGLEIEVGKTVQILKMEGRDDVPRTLSLSCGYNLVLQNETAPLDVRPVGVLSFGVGGANITIEFDLLSAMVFNVCATSLNLSVSNPGSPVVTDLNPVIGSKIFAQAMVGDGGAGRSGINPLRRTIAIGTIAPGIGILVQVPTGAVGYNVMTTTPGGLGALQAIQSLSPVNTLPLSTTVNPQFDIGLGAVGLVSGARALEINNAGAADVDDVSVVFTLAF